MSHRKVESFRSSNALSFAVLASGLAGKNLLLLQSVKEQNGFEGCRRVVTEYESRVASRRLSVLPCFFYLRFTSLDHLWEELLIWESPSDMYERLGGKFIDQERKLAPVNDALPRAFG